MERQMSLFEEGGLADDGMAVEPVTGNEVPPGSMASEVRDDIDAKLSEGEYVVPADVVRYYGVKFFEELRAEAKSGMSDMEANGRIGGEPVDQRGIPMDEEDDMEVDDLTPEEMQFLESMMAGGEAPARGMAEGGIADLSDVPTGGLFNPADYQLGFSSGQGTSATTSTGYENRWYVDKNGNRRIVLFLNGQPIQEVPEGYLPDTPENRESFKTDTEEMTDLEKEIERREREAAGPEEGDAGYNPNVSDENIDLGPLGDAISGMMENSVVGKALGVLGDALAGKKSEEETQSEDTEAETSQAPEAAQMSEESIAADLTDAATSGKSSATAPTTDSSTDASPAPAAEGEAAGGGGGGETEGDDNGPEGGLGGPADAMAKGGLASKKKAPTRKRKTAPKKGLGGKK